jgi:hypothetical protein
METPKKGNRKTKGSDSGGPLFATIDEETKAKAANMSQYDASVFTWTVRP